MPTGALLEAAAKGVVKSGSFCGGFLAWTLWRRGLRRWFKAPFCKGVGSNPTGVIAMCCVQLSNVDTPVLLLRLGNTVMERSGDGERG